MGYVIPAIAAYLLRKQGAVVLIGGMIGVVYIYENHVRPALESH